VGSEDQYPDLLGSEDPGTDLSDLARSGYFFLGSEKNPTFFLSKKKKNLLTKVVGNKKLIK
jgi:hypothetical protein